MLNESASQEICRINPRSNSETFLSTVNVFLQILTSFPMALFSSFLCSSLTWSPPVIISDFIWNVPAFPVWTSFWRLWNENDSLTRMYLKHWYYGSSHLPMSSYPMSSVAVLSLSDPDTKFNSEPWNWRQVHLVLTWPIVGVRSRGLGSELEKVWAAQLGRKAWGMALCLTPTLYSQSLMSWRVDSDKLLPHMPLVALNRHSGKYCSRSIVVLWNYFTQVTCRTEVFIIFFNVVKFPWLQHLGKS